MLGVGGCGLGSVESAQVELWEGPVGGLHSQSQREGSGPSAPDNVWSLSF